MFFSETPTHLPKCALFREILPALGRAKFRPGFSVSGISAMREIDFETTPGISKQFQDLHLT